MNETIEQQLARLGWELYAHPDDVLYRAECGGFYSAFRNSKQAVLEDVLKIKARENAAAAGPEKSRY